MEKAFNLGRAALVWTGVAFFFVWTVAGIAIGYQAMHIGTLVGGKVGVLPRIEGIEAQTYVMAKNATEISANLKTATANWNNELAQESTFIATTLPQLRDRAFKVTDQVGGVSSQLDQNLDTLNTQEAEIGPLLVSAKGLTDKATPAIADLDIAVKRLPPAIDSATDAFDTFNDKMNSKSMNEFLANSDQFSGNLALISGDFYTRLHPILNPAPCVGKYCWVKNGYSRLAALFPALQAIYDTQRVVYGPEQTIKLATSPRPLGAPHYKKQAPGPPAN